jgi:putative redox protein
MLIRLTGTSRLRLEMETPGFEIDGGVLSPFHLLAASLASCTAVAVESWASGVGLDATSLAIDVTWELAEERPARVTHIEEVLVWPGLPPERVDTVKRVAELCAIHATLDRCTVMTLHVKPA